jgi:pectate lyase
VRTTTGGEGGEVVVVTTLEELVMYAGAEEPYVIQISGTIVGDVTVASNKTIEGLADARVEGSLEIQGDDGSFVSNVIVRNLTIAGVACPGDGCSSTDAVRIYRAHHVWIDHCDISDGDDGNLDITAEADYVTVSWCRFSYSSASGSHRFSNLVGAADESTEDADDLGITFHHNWWADNIAERMPRVRFGDVHVFNNYYTPVGSSYCIRPGVEANLLVENNYFDGQDEPFDTTDPTASIAATGNVFAPDPVEEPMQGDVFEPPYPYMHVLDDAADVPGIVQAGAGPS